MTFYASAWQIALSALLPVFFCLLLFLAEAKGPLAKPIQQCKGLVAPYFTVISILFGLFAALLAGDVWQRTNNAKWAVQAEAQAVHALATLPAPMAWERSCCPSCAPMSRRPATRSPIRATWSSSMPSSRRPIAIC